MATDRQRAIQANKRGRGSSNIGSSSSSRQQRAPRPAQRFPDEVPARFQPKVSLENLRRKTVIGHRTLVFADMERLGFGAQIQQFITPDWRNLFEIRTPVFRHLCEEFFSTFRLNTEENRVTATAMTFSLGGVTHTMSYAEFGVSMGLYTEDEVSEDPFVNGLATWPVGINAKTFWNSNHLGQEDYHFNIKQSSMTNPFYRILLRGIAESISNRGNCPNNATSQDLFYLYCIIEHRPCNLAKCLAFYLYERGHGKDRGAIAGGAFVCHLALQMRLVMRDDLGSIDGFGPIAPVGSIDQLALRNMGIVDQKGNVVGAQQDSDDDSDEDSSGGDEPGPGQVPLETTGGGSGYGFFPSDFMDRFSSLEVGIRQIGEQQARFDDRQSRFEDTHRMISSQIGRVAYTTDYYQPYWQSLAEREAAETTRPLPPYQPPPLYMPEQVYDGFYVPPTSYYGGPSVPDTGVGGPGSVDQPQPFFGAPRDTYEGGGTDSVFGGPDDMAD